MAPVALPKTVAVRSTPFSGAAPVLGLAERVVAKSGDPDTTTELLQAWVSDWLPALTVTLPVLLPLLEYDFTTD